MSDTQPTAAQPPEPPEQPAEQPVEQPVVPPPPPPTQAPAGPAYAPDRPRLRDRLFGLRALVAVALAGVVLGGLAGFGIHAATDGDGPDDRFGRVGPGGFRNGPGDGFPGPGQGPGPGPGPGPATGPRPAP